MLPGLALTPGAFSSFSPLTLVHTTVNTSAQANYTFSNVPIEGPGLIVVVVSLRNSSSVTISNVSIGGTAGTVATRTSSAYPTGIFYRRVTSGSTATVTVNSSASVANCAIAVYRIVGNSSDTPFHTASNSADNNPSSVSLNIPNGGIAIAGAQMATNVSTTWTNLTEDVDAAQGGGTYSTASAEYLAAQTGRSISAASTVKIQSLVAASWS